MTIYCPRDIDAQEHNSVLSRIKKKKEDYEKYNFSTLKDWTFRAFFDLAQEYQALENFYKVCVFVPKEFLGFDSCLYLLDFETKELKVTCDSLNGLKVCGSSPPDNIHLSDTPYKAGDSFMVPIKGNLGLFPEKPLSQAKDVIGMFEVFPLFQFAEEDRLFFEKYANRIGYSLHYKLIAQQNKRHIKFINDLVADIGHNVITPNMQFRIFLNRISRKLDSLEGLAVRFRECINQVSSEGSMDEESLNKLDMELTDTISKLKNDYNALNQHYINTSIFLESLLRRDHFQKGELVLKRRMCNFKKEVIDPQLERYRARLERMGIRIDSHMGGVPDEDFPLSVDIGLISQVYANLFSNVEKYCTEVPNGWGQMVKFMAYGREIIPDFFGPGKPGIKFNVFSTGQHINPEQAKHLFEEGFRARETASMPGSGHGLYFMKRIIEVHGGVLGYEPRPLGNNFYFILPLQLELPVQDNSF